MLDAGADQVRQRAALGLKGLFHHAGRLNLLVELAAVSDRLRIEEIADVAGHVVQAPQLLLVAGRKPVGRQSLIAGGLGKTRAGADTATQRSA